MTDFILRIAQQVLPNLAANFTSSVLSSLEPKTELTADEKKELETLRTENSSLKAENNSFKEEDKTVHKLCCLLLFGGLSSGFFAGYFIIPRPQPPRAVTFEIKTDKDPVEATLTEGNSATINGVKVEVKKP